MEEAVGEILAFGIGVALSPAAVVATTLMVAGSGGRSRAALFVATWSGCLLLVAAAALVLADGAGANEAGEPATWVVVLQVALGLLLVGVALTQGRGRRRDGVASEMPSWMRKVDGLTAKQAVGMAAFLASGKPKNLLLTIGAAVAIAELGVEAGAQAGALVVFVLLGALAPALPLAASLVLRERSAEVLGGLRRWMIRENATIVAVLCLVFAAKLLGDALSA